MNKEEKEMVIAFAIAVVVFVATCVLSPHVCIIGSIIAVATTLWAFMWTKIFGELLQETKQQKPKCVTDN
jgi:hypothetical protein